MVTVTTARVVGQKSVVSNIIFAMMITEFGFDFEAYVPFYA